jgi:hypothetical protein
LEFQGSPLIVRITFFVYFELLSFFA